MRSLHSAEQGDADDFQIMQSKENDKQTADDIHRCTVIGKERTDAAGKKSHQAEHDSKSKYKRACPCKGMLFFVGISGKIGNIDGEHGEHTGGNKGNDAL